MPRALAKRERSIYVLLGSNLLDRNEMEKIDIMLYSRLGIMAFNQVTIFLFAPKFAPAVELAPTGLTPSGKPIAIVSACVSDPTAPKVVAEELRRWFMAQGYREKDRYGGHQSLFWGQHPTVIGLQQEVELGLPLEQDEVQELRIRFLLTENTPDRFYAWRNLIVNLGHDFGFRLMDEDHQLLPCSDFTTVFDQSWSFRSYQKQYGWRL